MNGDGGPRWHGMRVIASGANRVCVLDPRMPGHCLKYELRPAPRMRRYWRRRVRHELSRLAPRLGLNATELLAWRRLRARLGDALDEHAAECIGVVQTEAGPALRARLVTDADGRLAPSLAMLFDDPLPAFSAASLIQALDEFESWLLAHRIPLSDLNAGNFAVVERDGRVRLVCVDLKSTVSSRELVPLSRWSWALMQRKIIRRCQRLRQRIGACPGEAALTDLTGLS